MVSIPEMNKGTSKVFFALVEGLRTPGEISKKFCINHSAVIQQLNRLKKVHLLKHGEEKGRQHYYEIDWDGYCKLVLGYMFPSVFMSWESESERWAGMTAKEKEEIKDIAHKLSKNEYLKNLVILYTKEFVSLGSDLNYTIEEIAWEFNTNIYLCLPLIKKIRNPSKETKEFIRIFSPLRKEWAKRIPQEALETAIGKSASFK